MSGGLQATPQAPVNGARRLCVLVVDDHDVVQWGFRAALACQAWVQRYLAAANASGALELARRYEPHVALVDDGLEEESGIELCCEIVRTVTTRVLLMSSSGRVSPREAQAAGASGLVSKHWPTGDLGRAVRMVGLGMSVFEPRSGDSAPLLSHREQQVLDLLALGATNREIGATLFLSPQTVKEHASRLYRKMDARNRAQAVLRAQRMGLLA
jgi:two-component system response regulator DesR